MITILTGAPGHGKSYSLVKRIDQTLHKGTPIVTNVPLREDWAEVMAKRHTFLPWLRKEAVAKKADHFRRLVLISDDVNELVRARFTGTKEGRALMVIDESQRKMNVRNYRDADQVRLVDFISAHRHYGLDVILATQHMENLDSQIKRLYEYHAEVRNFRRMPLLGSIFRINIFLRVTRWNDRRKTKAGIELYFLSRGLARLYATHALQEVDWPEDAIILPLQAEAPELFPRWSPAHGWAVQYTH